MKKPNIELNLLKLNQKKIQLDTIGTQLAELNEKLKQVSERYEAKKQEVFQLETYIQDAQSKVVSN